MCVSVARAARRASPNLRIQPGLSMRDGGTSCVRLATKWVSPLRGYTLGGAGLKSHRYVPMLCFSTYMGRAHLCARGPDPRIGRPPGGDERSSIGPGGGTRHTCPRQSLVSTCILAFLAVTPSSAMIDSGVRVCPQENVRVYAKCV